jgi:hypothetical protein
MENANGLPAYFCYWGKADLDYPGEKKWHPLAVHQGKCK